MLRDWEGLRRYAHIAVKDDTPYRELLDLTRQVIRFDDPAMPRTFIHGVCNCFDNTKKEVVVPARLFNIQNFDPGPFQRLWKAMELHKITKGKEFSAVLQRILAQMEIYDAYKAAVASVQIAMREKRFKSISGRVAAAVTEHELYKNLLPDMSKDDKKKAYRYFTYNQRIAESYLKL